MEKKNLDWANLGFGYVKTDKRFVANYKDGAWDDGVITDDDKVVLNECAGVLQYAQTCFEGLKAYTTEDGHIVMFRPDLNAQRMHDSCERLEMPPFPVDKFVQAVTDTVKANAAWVPPFGSGATLYIRPYMFGSNPVIGVKPADEYQFRILTTPVGPYFKGGAKPLTIKVSDFDRAAPHGTGHIKAGLNYAMSLYAITDAHEHGYAENMYLDAATRTNVEETGGANFLFVTKDGGIDVDASYAHWRIISIVLCLVSAFGCMLEYYFTRERITEETANLNVKEEKLPLKKQLEGCIHNKYWWIIILYFLIFQFGQLIKNLSLIHI